MIDYRLSFRIRFIIPRFIIIGSLFGVEPGEEPFLERETRFYDKARISVIDQIVSMKKFVFDDMVAEPVEKSDIGARAKFDVKIRLCCRAGETWVHHDEPCALIHGLAYPTESNRVVFCGIAAYDQDTITVGKIVPMIGHCATTKSRPQRGHRG